MNTAKVTYPNYNHNYHYKRQSRSHKIQHQDHQISLQDKGLNFLTMLKIAQINTSDSSLKEKRELINKSSRRRKQQV